MRKTATLLLTGVFITALSGCATMNRGAYEKVEITSTPPGAHCKMYREGQGFLKAIATPGSKYIQRNDKPLTIVCSKEGYKTVTITDASDTDENLQGSVTNFANLGIGFIIDESNQARNSVADRFEITLERL